MVRAQRSARVSIVAAALGAALLGGGAPRAAAWAAFPAPGPAHPAGTPAARPEAPVAAQASPAGDIPDTQAFVTFISRGGGYALEVPEGWARTARGPDVLFVDKLDGVQVTVAHAARAPTAARARTAEVAALVRSGRAVQVSSVRDVRLPGGAAVLVAYTSDSEPNPVTGRQVRLEDNAYLFFKDGRLATLTLWAPVGADNADQWRRMARSFRWL